MSRVKIELPSQFSFTATLPIRITDLNYGNHVGNDSVLSLIHEARVRFFLSKGYTELKLEGVSLIMSDAAIEFKAELFYGDVVTIEVGIHNFSKVGFDLGYRLKNKEQVVALAKTGMICYDYSKRKVVSLPQVAKERLVQD